MYKVVTRPFPYRRTTFSLIKVSFLIVVSVNTFAKPRRRKKTFFTFIKRKNNKHKACKLKLKEKEK